MPLNDLNWLDLLVSDSRPNVYLPNCLYKIKSQHYFILIFFELTYNIVELLQVETFHVWYFWKNYKYKQSNLEMINAAFQIPIISVLSYSIFQ